MSRVIPRAGLHDAELLRFLNAKGLLQLPLEAQDVGQALGDWFDFRQAIALQGFFSTLDSTAATLSVACARVDPQVLRERFARIRAALEQSILQGTPPAPTLARIDEPLTELDPPIDLKTAFDPFRRFALGHQRQMEQVIKGLRAQLRSMLDTGGDAQKQLAQLDALFENVLIAREARSLGQIPLAFEKRFAQALKQHMKQLLEAAEADEPAPRTTPWLGPLLDDLRTALLAELDLRLQPVLGLIEALTQDTPQEQ